MRVMAMDCSSSPCSAAVLADTRLSAEETWEPAGLRNQSIFEAIPALLRKAGVSAADIDLFAAGIGPGAFTALRMACAALAGLALPGGKPVVGIASCEAIALALAEEGAAGPISVIGDARRGRIWHAQYRMEQGWPVVMQAPALFEEASLPEALRGSATVAAPEWQRVADVLARAGTGAATCIERDCAPRASTLARLAAQSFRSGAPAFPAYPLYLTAATLVAPRYPAE
jgi:tRNA threonylcarbamoyladenosine biosynthesis protein TsaB